MRRKRRRGIRAPHCCNAGLRGDACHPPTCLSGGVGAPDGWHVFSSVMETKEGAVDLGNSAFTKGPKRDQNHVLLGPGLVGLWKTRTAWCETGALELASAGVLPTVNDTLRVTQEISRRHLFMSGGSTSRELGDSPGNAFFSSGSSLGDVTSVGVHQCPCPCQKLKPHN